MVACEQVPKWGIVRRLKSRSERGGGGEKEKEGACGHSSLMPPFRLLVINL